jgi:hypothetical protein
MPTDRNKNLNAASGAASKRLKEAHPDEWNRYMKEEATARGEEWAPKATPEQKAKEEFERLLRDYPHLAKEFASEPDEPGRESMGG